MTDGADACLGPIEMLRCAPLALRSAFMQNPVYLLCGNWKITVNSVIGRAVGLMFSGAVLLHSLSDSAHGCLVIFVTVTFRITFPGIFVWYSQSWVQHVLSGSLCLKPGPVLLAQVGTPMEPQVGTLMTLAVQVGGVELQVHPGPGASVLGASHSRQLPNLIYSPGASHLPKQAITT